jgi:hypothetical protein
MEFQLAGHLKWPKSPPFHAQKRPVSGFLKYSLAAMKPAYCKKFDKFVTLVHFILIWEPALFS